MRLSQFSVKCHHCKDNFTIFTQRNNRFVASQELQCPHCGTNDFYYGNEYYHQKDVETIIVDKNAQIKRICIMAHEQELSTNSCYSHWEDEVYKDC